MRCKLKDVPYLQFIAIDDNEYIIPPEARFCLGVSSSEEFLDLFELQDIILKCKNFGIEHDNLSKAIPELTKEHHIFIKFGKFKEHRIPFSL
jgi:hypothetical protein